ncbi:MAG: hypothetical protein OEN20_04290 [Gammaproteobacteria bacterium]|nr:hypothetical protein [Gammaproteobacteria bacterium]
MRISRIVLAGLITSSTLFAGTQDNTVAAMTVHSLTQEGWRITGTNTRNETRPGLPPYENLPRIVSITTYTLARGGQTANCEIVYDSQRDTIEEQCAHSNP